MAQLIDLSLVPALDADGVAVSGAELRFFATGTSTPAPVYTTDALSVAHPVPLLSNAAGRFPAVYTSGATELRATLTIGGSVVRDIDPINPLLPASAMTVTGGDTVQDAITDLQSAITQTGINVRVAPYSADGTGTTDATAAFQAAIDAAYEDGACLVIVPPGNYRIDGTVFLKPGVHVVGNNVAREWNAPVFLERYQTRIFKPATGSTDGPIFEMANRSVLRGLDIVYLRLSGASTGIVRFGPAASSGQCFNAKVYDCSIEGRAFDGGTTYYNAQCHGIFSPESTFSPTRQRYFNEVVNCYLVNLDRGVHLGGQSNGWTLMNVRTFQVYRPFYFDGGASEVADTLIEGAHPQCFGTLPTATTAVFTFVNAVNVFKASGVSECNGQAYDVSGATTLNQVDLSDYVPNEPIPSYLPATVEQQGFSTGTMREGLRRTFVPEPSRDLDRYNQLRGMEYEGPITITGSLPTLNGGAAPQALVASNASSRIILRWNAGPYSMGSHPVMLVKLQVIVDGPGTTEASVAEVEFWYRRTTSTGAGAAQVSVIRSTNRGGGIAGLHFISSKTQAGQFFKIGMVGGGSGGGAADYVVCRLEVMALAADSSVWVRDGYTNITTDAIAATAADVTDSIQLLSTGDTSI